MVGMVKEMVDHLGIKGPVSSPLFSKVGFRRSDLPLVTSPNLPLFVTYMTL